MYLPAIEAFLRDNAKRPLSAAAWPQVVYERFGTDELLILCQRRIPGFAIDFHVLPLPMGGVMMMWRYDLCSSLWKWQRTRPEEFHMGGTYRSIRECLVAVLSRVDRFDLWTYEQNQQEAVARAQRAAAAAPTEAPSREQDEGDEVVQVEDLPGVTPLEKEKLSVVPADDKTS